MTITGGNQRVAYTVEHRGNCVLITGGVPAGAFHALTMLAPKKSVLDPDVARIYGANFAFGLRADLEVLRQAGSAAAEQRERQANPGLSEDAVRWLARGERGASSNTIFAHLTCIDALAGDRKDHPYDPDDFRRCRLLLEQVPSLVPLFHRMASVSTEWSNLVEQWPAICDTMDTESPEWRKRRGAASNTYDLIQRAISR